MTPAQRAAAERLAAYHAEQADHFSPFGSGNALTIFHDEAAALLRELLAEPQGEPVAWLYRSISGAQFVHFYKNTPRFLADQDAAEQWPDAHSLTPLYTHPPQQRQPLTDDQIIDIGNEEHRAMPAGSDEQDELLAIARAVERAHGMGEAP